MDGIVIGYGNYREYKAALDRELNRTAEGFVKIGYLLKVARDTDILKESGYKSLAEFAQAEYSLDASQVSRFIAINDKYSEGGYGETLMDQYQGFGYAKLSLMLTMPEEIVNLISPAYSKSEMLEIKSEVEEEKKISDLEVLSERGDSRMESMSELGKMVYQMGRENPEIYEKLYAAAGRGDWDKELHEVLAPAGENVISVRIKGTGRVMLSIKEAGTDVKLVHVRSNETSAYSWEEFAETVRQQLDPSEATAKEAWEKMYGEEWPIEEKKEIAPVQKSTDPQKKPQKKTEKKVIKAKPEPPKRKPKEVEKFIQAPEKTEEPKTEAPKTEETKTEETKTEEEKTCPEGQMELIRDFPEFVPEPHRLTDRDENGNWCLKGIAWEDVMPGKTITQTVYEHLYAALWKLMEYEDTGYTPEEIEKR